MNIHDCIICPKCQKKFMKKSLHPTFGKEYYCHYCHLEFGVNELVNLWNYDAGDLYDNSGITYPVTHANYKSWYPSFWGKSLVAYAIEDLLFPFLFLDIETGTIRVVDTVSPIDEPQFKSSKERDEAYEVVTRMFLDIPEYEEGCGNEGIDIGIEGYPC